MAERKVKEDKASRKIAGGLIHCPVCGKEAMWREAYDHLEWFCQECNVEIDTDVEQEDWAEQTMTLREPREEDFPNDYLAFDRATRAYQVKVAIEGERRRDKSSAVQDWFRAHHAYHQASIAYNTRLALVRAERERGNWSVGTDLEYAALNEAQKVALRADETLYHALRDVDGELPRETEGK